MDWFNTQFYRDFGYGVVYPQIFPNHKRPTDEHHEGVSRGAGQGEGLVPGARQALPRQQRVGRAATRSRSPTISVAAS